MLEPGSHVTARPESEWTALRVALAHEIVGVPPKLKEPLCPPSLATTT